MVCSVSEFRGHHGLEVKTAGASNDRPHPIHGRKAERGRCLLLSSQSLSLPVSLDSVSLSLWVSLCLSLYFCLYLLCLCISVYLSVISVSVFLSLCVFLFIYLLSLSLCFSFFLFLSLDQDPSHVETPTAVLSISTSKIKITLHRCAQRPISWVILDSGELAVNPSCHRVIHLSSVSILLGYWPPDRLADELACMATVAVRMEKVSLFTSPTSFPIDI